MYDPLVYEDIEVNDRVILISDDGGEYEIGDNNPLDGTEYFCEGTVYEIAETYDMDPQPINVEWDNGCHNVYKPETLAFADPLHKTKGRCKSIW